MNDPQGKPTPYLRLMALVALLGIVIAAYACASPWRLSSLNQLAGNPPGGIASS